MQETRTPLGELLIEHRLRLSMSQRELAHRTFVLSRTLPDVSAVSERTIISLEQPVPAGGRQRLPRVATVHSLARGLELEPDTPAFDRFLRAGAGERIAPVADTTSPGADFVAAGREAHLRRLRDLIDRASDGEPGVAFVSADPGAGKTWLIEAACREASRRAPDLAVLWTQCTGRLGSADPHQPFRQMLELMVDDPELASPRQRLTPENAAELRRRAPRAATAVATGGQDLVDRFIAADRLLHPTLDADTRAVISSAISRSQTGPTNINDQFLHVLTRYAAEGPVVLVLEDLHWSDIGTSTVLFHLLHRLHRQHAPVVIIGSYRPGDLAAESSSSPHPFPPVLHEVPRLYRDPVIDLSTAVGGDAGRAFVSAMVDRMWGGSSPDAIERLYARSGGLPLLVSGLLQKPERGRMDVDATDDARELPAEIQSLFAQQLAGLDPSLRQLLAAASVQGTGFLAEVVGEALEIPRVRLIDMLDAHLGAASRLVVPGGTSRIAGQTVHEYQFNHALLRDSLYASLPDAERRGYHAATAEAMTRMFGAGEHDGTATIAWHLEQIGDLPGAGEAWLRAGNHALDTSAYERAERYYARVLALASHHDDPALTVHGHIGAGNTARALGAIDAARDHLAQARHRAEQQGFPALEASAISALGMLDFDAGRVRDGARRLERAIELHLDAGERDRACQSMARLSHNLYGLGAYDAAMASARRGVELAERLGNDQMVIAARIALANCWLDLGHFERARAAYEACLAVASRHLDSHRENICMLNIALCAIELGDPDEADRIIARVRGPGRSVVKRFQGQAESYLGLAHEARGNLGAAKTCFARSLRIRTLLRQEALVLDSLAGLLRIAVRAGDDERAAQLSDDLERQVDARGVDGVEHVARLYLALVEAALLLDDQDRADRHLRAGIAFLEDRAARMREPADRESFLTRPPAHRHLLELARSASGPDEVRAG